MSSQHSGDNAAAKACKRYAKSLTEYLVVLESLAKAADAHVLHRKHLVLFKARVFLVSLLTDPQTLLRAALDHKLLQLLLAATTNSFNSIVREAGDPGLVNFTTAAVTAVMALCADVAAVLSKIPLLSKLAGNVGEHLIQIEGTGFVPALISFTECAVTSLEHHATVLAEAATSSQTQQPLNQQQQRHQRRDAKKKQKAQSAWRYYPTTELYQSLLHLWVRLVTVEIEETCVLHQEALVVPAFAAAARLASRTAPLLSKAQSLATALLQERHQFTNTKMPMIITSAMDFQPEDFRSLTQNSVILSFGLVSLITHLTRAPQGSPQQQQQRVAELEQIWRIEHLDHVLLQMLTGQATGLYLLSEIQAKAAAHSADQRNSSAASNDPSTNGSNQQQKVKQQQRVFQSHIECLNNLGLCTVWPWEEPAMCSYGGVCCDAVMDTLKRLLQWRSETMFRPSIPSTQTEQQQQAEQQPKQQQDAGHRTPPFPAQHLQVTIMLLIEIALLLPPKDISLQVSSLELIMLLLRTSAAAAAINADFEAPAVVLTAAAAGRLLHPVVQLLSKAVIRTLKETHYASPSAPDQQEQQDEANTHSARYNCERRLLLHHFGSLLMAVCQAVEPKHVAAALKSDPVIPLVAIEAVIRYQASRQCHLEPHDSCHHQHQHQQQQQSSPATGDPAVATVEQINTTSLSMRFPGAAYSVQGTQPRTVVTKFPDHQAVVLLLLPFVGNVIQAIRYLIDHRQLSLLTEQIPSYLAGQLAGDLAIRLFSLTATVLKVVQVATSFMESGGSSDAAVAANGDEMASSQPDGQVDELAEAVTLGAATALQQDDSACLPSGYLLGIAHAVIDLAAGWEVILKSADTVSAEHFSMPVTLLLQAVNVLAAAMCPGSRVLASHICHKVGLHSAADSFSDQRGCSSELAGDLHTISSNISSSSSSSYTFIGSSSLNQCSSNSNAKSVVVESQVAAALAQEHAAVQQRLHEVVSLLEKSTAWRFLPVCPLPASGINKASLWCWLYFCPADCRDSLTEEFKRLLGGSLHQGCHKSGDCCLHSGDIVEQEVENSFEPGQPAITAAITQKDPSEAVAQHHAPFSNSTHVGSGCARADMPTVWEQQADQFYKCMQAAAVKAGARFPSSYRCNNPSCVNLSKLSEYQLVSGKACVCGGCKLTRYCSRECQKRHWKMHKLLCRQMQQGTSGKAVPHE